MAIVVGPLVRYENGVVSVVALLWLIRHRRYAAFTILSLLTLLPLAAFSLFLHSQGLSWLPSSVQAKSVSLFGGSSSLLANIAVNLNHRQALALLFGGVLMVYVVTTGKNKTLPLLTLLAILVHFGLGRFGWWDRYEVYILAFVSFMLIFLFQDRLARLNRWLILVGFFIIFLPYMLNVLYTPLGCNNIYQQQHQMARFVQQEWPEPVAVNDLGWVAFSNTTPILDLWGLASPQVLKLRRADRSGAWMDSLAQAHQVRLAMIYEAYFPLLPEKWTCVGKLFLGRRKVTADQPVVGFYATHPQDVAALHDRLSHFMSSLPPGVRLQMVGRLR
jgi:hypothetical protein